MIKVNGVILEESLHKEIDKNNLMCGEVNSASMSFMKTPLYIYGKNIDEIMQLAKSIKTEDASYDTVDIYSELDIDEREYISTKRI